jgi:lipopolysaccharide assembly outer membrane protein LptD (OstA)
MEMKRIACAFACLIASAGASAQSPDAVTPAPTASELVSSTLPRDIETASYYELVAWCQELGLDDSGSRKDLQARLYTHYKIAPEAAPPKPSRTISVRSAKESEYFTVEEMEQKYISLRGNVVVVLTDSESGTVQEIRAQSIVYNQTLNIVTAKGGVEYSTVKNGTKETFTGDSLTFDVNTWEGTFYDGRTVRPQKRTGQDVNFYFDGETITRLENDTVVMDDGGFTSCDIAEAPHYQLRADRVWILAPGEWALQNAVLFVGRIPAFYFPVFFYPGDELFFNPSLGYDDRKGEYLQTTTYLIGRKKKNTEESTSFSFMQLQGDADQDFDLELRGLFLRKIPSESDTPAKPGPTLKLMLDAYSRLGLFLGLEGDFTPLSVFKLGIAASRTVFQYGLEYTPFYILSDGTETSYWNQSSIFGIPVPFRFGMSGNLSASVDFASVSSHFEYYSDPSFTQDFYTRSEGMQFTSNLESLIAEGQTVNLQSNLSWDVNSKFDFARLLKVPWIQSLSIPNLSLKFTWQSRETPTTVYTPEASDPGRFFYYPSSLVAPTVSATISGEIFRYNSAAQKPAAAGPAPSTATRASEAPKPDPGKGFRPPLKRDPEQPAALQEKSARFAFLVPQRRKDEPVSGREVQNTVSLSYQTTTRATMEQSFDSSAWTSQEDVDFAIQYGTLETGGSSQISSSISLLDKLLSGSLAFSADGGLRLRFNPSETLLPATWESLLLGDLQQDRFNLKTTLQAALNPFTAIPMISATNVSYRLGLKLYGITVEGPDPLNPIITTLKPAWDKDSVSDHSISTTLAVKIPDVSATVALSAQLPPRDPNLTGSLDFILWLFQTHVQSGASKTEDEWQFNPLVIRESLALSKDITASEELQLDLNPPGPDLDKSISQLKLWGFTAGFTAQNMIPINGLGIPIGTDELFLPASLRFGYDLTADTLWLWKNRIKLDGSVKTSWNQNLQKFVENSLDFSLSLNVSIFRFLELSFSSVSYNNKMYRYIPGWPEEFGAPSVNPIWDLARSFNFFNIDDRHATAFKLRSISIKAVCHFHDWDLNLEYTGSPKLTTIVGEPQPQYQWTPAFSIQVKWTAIPEVNARIHKDASGEELYIRD